VRKAFVVAALALSSPLLGFACSAGSGNQGTAGDEAEIESLATAKEADEGIPFKPECHAPPFNCPVNVNCASKNMGLCYLTACGTGECKSCPFLKNMVIDHWCSFICTAGGSLTGTAWTAVSRPFKVNLGPYCIPL
jgi:hypothetical protein